MALAPHDSRDNDPAVGVEDDSELAAIQARAAYDERLSARISDLRNFINILEYQQQFGDPRFLDVVDREGAAFFRLLDSARGVKMRKTRHEQQLQRPGEPPTQTPCFYVLGQILQTTILDLYWLLSSSLLYH